MCETACDCISVQRNKLFCSGEYIDQSLQWLYFSFSVSHLCEDSAFRTDSCDVTASLNLSFNHHHVNDIDYNNDKALFKTAAKVYEIILIQGEL